MEGSLKSRTIRSTTSRYKKYKSHLKGIYLPGGATAVSSGGIQGNSGKERETKENCRFLDTLSIILGGQKALDVFLELTGMVDQSPSLLLFLFAVFFFFFQHLELKRQQHLPSPPPPPSPPSLVTYCQQSIVTLPFLALCCHTCPSLEGESCT